MDTPEVPEPLPAGRAAPAADTRPPWRVAVLGPGGIGGLLAALLARDGDQVTCIAPAALGGALVVPFLNGIEHVALLRRRYPADQVVAATIRIESARLQRIGMDVRVRDDEPRMLWAKLSVLAPIALLGTHEDAPIGVVRERRRDDFAAVVREITEAARAADGVELDPRVALGMLDQVPAAMRSSMQRDAEAGKPLELDAIGGTILRAAARGGVKAPGHRATGLRDRRTRRKLVTMPTRRRYRLALLVGALFALAACSSSGGGAGSATTASSGRRAVPATMTVTSSAFTAGGAIPARYTCKGDNVSPPLRWSAPPAGTQELALVVDDPDAPGGTFVHWVLAGIPASLTQLQENAVPEGAREARNSKGSGYTGPCPPSGKAHHYRFTVYALGRSPEVAQDADPVQAIGAIQAAATAQGQLVGTFQT